MLFKTDDTKKQAILLVRRYNLREDGCIFNFCNRNTKEVYKYLA